jgi:hypothetical protein
MSEIQARVALAPVLDEDRVGGTAMQALPLRPAQRARAAPAVTRLEVVQRSTVDGVVTDDCFAGVAGVIAA